MKKPNIWFVPTTFPSSILSPKFWFYKLHFSQNVPHQLILTGIPGTHLWPFLAQKHKSNFLPKDVLNLNLSFYTSAISSKKYEEFRFTHFFKLKKHSLGNVGPKSLQQDSPYQKKFIYISVKPLCMFFQHHARDQKNSTHQFFIKLQNLYPGPISGSFRPKKFEKVFFEKKYLFQF